MKRIFSILALSIVMVSSAYAAPKTNNANAPKVKVKSTVVDSAKTAAQDTISIKEEPAKAAPDRSSARESIEEGNAAFPPLFPLISTILAVLALGSSAFIFFNSKSRYDELYDRYRKVKDDLYSIRFDIRSDITQRIDSNAAIFDSKLTAMKGEILNELKSAQTIKSEVTGNKAEVIAKPKSMRFVSQTFYGIYKSKIKGVYVDQMTEMREGNSTLEIVMVSNNEANVHLVEGLTKTQFSGLMGDAVQVTEGNPQSFEIISEKEAGHMTLNEDIWILTQAIKVKLA